MSAHHHHHDSETHAGHGHGHQGHGHHHPLPANRHAFVLATALNTGFVAVEFFYGWLANSTALMADAGHNLSDVLGLLLAWSAIRLSKVSASERYTFGLRSSSILAALGNAMLLLLVSGAIAWEALLRWFSPEPAVGLTVMAVAGVGLVVNGFSAWLFTQGREHDLNIRGAYLHMLADALVSLGVVVGGLVMWQTGWTWVDPVMSLIIVAVIVYGTWGLLKESVQLALSAVPAHIDIEALTQHLLSMPGVVSVHDLHVWGMSTTETALTVHLVMPQGHPGDAALEVISESLQQHFRIQHSTLQVELTSIHHSCCLAH